MFVRWKRRRCGSNKPYSHYIDAVLVENYREDGKIKQRFIKHLASIPDSREFAWLLWREVSKRLNTLNLDQATEDKIVRDIERRFLHDTPEEQKKRDDHLARLEGVVTKK